MTSRKKYTYDGKSLTLSEWSKETGINVGTLFARLETLKWSLEKTLTTPSKKSNVKKYTHNGKSLTLAEWSKVTGINAGTLFARIERYGWSLDKALTTSERIKNKKYNYNGKSLNLDEWSRETGINVGTLSARLETYKWTLEEALTTPLNSSRNSKKYIHNGKSLTLTEWGKETGISKTTLASRIEILKWSLEKALTTPVESKTTKKLYDYCGESLTLEQWSVKLSIPIGTLRSRLFSSNWTIEKTLSTPLKIPELYTYKGESKTLSEWSKITGLSLNLLFNRISKNWSVEKALTTPVEYKTTEKLYEYCGESLTLEQWSVKLSIPVGTLTARLFRLNWTIEKTLSTPLKVSELYTYKGESKTLSEWSKLTGVSFSLLSYRLSKNWSIEKALTTPVKPIKKTKKDSKTKG